MRPRTTSRPCAAAPAAPPASEHHARSTGAGRSRVPGVTHAAAVPTPYESAAEAAARLAELTGVERHDIALVLGSGWLPAVDALGEATAEIDTTDLPGFSAAAVAGHSGKIRSIRQSTPAATSNLLVFLSRTHFYEGKGVAAVVHPVRTAAAAGCSAIVLTNGCGGLKQGWQPGQPVLISDHINLTGTSPIVGANFVDLTDLYSPRLRALCQEVDRLPRRGRLRAVPRPPLRDARRGPDGRRHGRPPRRHEHHARGHRRPRGRHGGPRHQPGHQPRRRPERRAAQPRGGPRGGHAPRPAGWAACSARSSTRI